MNNADIWYRATIYQNELYVFAEWGPYQGLSSAYEPSGAPIDDLIDVYTIIEMVAFAKADLINQFLACQNQNGRETFRSACFNAGEGTGLVRF